MKAPCTLGRTGAAQLPLIEQQDEFTGILPPHDSHAGIIGRHLLNGAILNSSDWSQTGLESTVIVRA